MKQYFLSMIQYILFKVERNSPTVGAPRVKLFERIIKCDTSLVPPYDTLLSSARFLFGSDVFVTFELSNV